jgi:antirestriction protein ArdC
MNVYEIVTDRIVSAIESGNVAPWRKPWNTSRVTLNGQPVNYPVNAVSGKTYRGINVFMLALTAQAAGYTDPRWLTFKQAYDLGGKVKKGEKSTPVVFWNWVEKTEENEAGETVTKRVPFLRYYNVFNVEQCKNLTLKGELVIEKGKQFDPVAEAVALAKTFTFDAEAMTHHGGNRAFYSRLEDRIQMPNWRSFETAEAYHATWFHEVGHATGAEKRMNRTFGKSFGDDAYSQEELVAEMISAFLCAECGIDSTLDQSAAYVGGWLKRLKDDSKLVIIAAGQAQNAVDYLLGRTQAEGAE